MISPKMRGHVWKGCSGHKFPWKTIFDWNSLDAVASFDGGVINLHGDAQAVSSTSANMHWGQRIAYRKATRNIGAARHVVETGMWWKSEVVEPLEQFVLQY